MQATGRSSIKTAGNARATGAVAIRSRVRGPWWKLGAAKVLATVESDTLAGYDLGNMILCRADLSGQDLRGTRFCVANLEEADLSNADLRGADLRRAYLRGADFSGADLRGADLTEAMLVDAVFAGARYDAETCWPAAFDPAARCAVPASRLD